MKNYYKVYFTTKERVIPSEVYFTQWDALKDLVDSLTSMEDCLYGEILVYNNIFHAEEDVARFASRLIKQNGYLNHYIQED